MKKSDIEAIFRAYLENPEQVKSDYEEYMTLYNEYLNAIDDTEPVPNKYSTNKDVLDYFLYYELFKQVDTCENYKEYIQNFLDRANYNIKSFDDAGMSPNTYSYRYQKRIIDLYTKAQSGVELKIEYVYGWDEYFDYDVVNIFIFISVILICSVVFAQERSSGFINIIRASRYGRVSTVAAKISASVIITVIIVLLFTFSTFFIYGYMVGFSSSDNAIQIIEAFRKTYQTITIKQYFIITVLVRLATFIVFTALTLAASLIFKSYPLIFICNGGVFGLNFLFYTLKNLDPESPIRNLNLVATAHVTRLFERYRAINIFGYPADYIPFMIFSFAVVFTAASIFIGWRFLHSAVSVGQGRINKALIFKTSSERIKQTQPKRRHIHISSRCLILTETYKTLVSSRYIIAVIVLLLVKVYISSNAYKPVSLYSDDIYKAYMTTLAGPVTDEKRQYIKEEREYINDVFLKETDIRDAYNSGAINLDEFINYLTELNYARSHSPQLSVVENHLSYIDRLALKGIEAHFVYDTGWNTFFKTPFDWSLYAVVLLIFSGIFSSEHEAKTSSGGFAQILRTTKRGRARTFGAKLTSSLIVALILAVIWNAIDAYFICRAYELPCISSPIHSLQLFQGLKTTVSIKQFIVLFYALRAAAVLWLVLLLCAFSEITKRALITIGAVAAVTSLPALISYFGIKSFDYVDYIGVMRATPMILLSAGGGSALMTFSIVAIIICTVALCLAEIMWVGCKI